MKYMTTEMYDDGGHYNFTGWMLEEEIVASLRFRFDLKNYLDKILIETQNFFYKIYGGNGIKYNRIKSS